MNALSEYQLTISLAVLQSRKFASLSLACHHFSAALFKPTDLCSISTCTLQPPSYCLSLSLCHFLPLSPRSLISSVSISLAWLPAHSSNRIRSVDRGCICDKKCTAVTQQRPSFVCENGCVIPCVKLCDLCKIVWVFVCVCVNEFTAVVAAHSSVWPWRLNRSRRRAPRFNRNLSSGEREDKSHLECQEF